MSYHDDGMDLLIYDKLRQMNGEKGIDLSFSNLAKGAVSAFKLVGPVFLLIYLAICGFTDIGFTVAGIGVALLAAAICSSVVLLWYTGIVVFWSLIILGIVSLVAGGVLLFLYKLVIN